MPIFADMDPSGSPAEIFKWVCIIIGSLIGLAGVIVLIIQALRKNKVAIDEQPVEVRKSPKRFNYDLAESRHVDHERRINHLENATAGFESKILKAGEERETRLRNEIHAAGKENDDSILKVHERINAILAGVSRLEGEIKQMNKS
jgi:hypothetical protein